MSEYEKLLEAKERNRKERIEFIHEYVKYLKKTPNKEWSKQQKEIVG